MASDDVEAADEDEASAEGIKVFIEAIWASLSVLILCGLETGDGSGLD